MSADATVTLADLLHAAMRLRGLADVPVNTQAAQMGIDQNTLHRLVTGKLTNPRFQTMQALCAYYRLPLAFFALTDPEAMTHALSQIQFAETPDLPTQIAQRTQRLSPWGQRNVHGLLARLEAASLS